MSEELDRRGERWLRHGRGAGQQRRKMAMI
jgi:hypothetical protein